MSKLADWYARAKDSAACRLAQKHVDSMLPAVRAHLEAGMQCPPGEERLALLFALTCKADDLGEIPTMGRVERVSHTDVLPFVRRD